MLVKKYIKQIGLTLKIDITRQDFYAENYILMYYFKLFKRKQAYLKYLAADLKRTRKFVFLVIQRNGWRD